MYSLAIKNPWQWKAALFHSKIFSGWILLPNNHRLIIFGHTHIIVLIHVMVYPKVLYSSPPKKKLKRFGFTTTVFLAYTWLVVEKNTLKNKPKSLGMIVRLKHVEIISCPIWEGLYFTQIITNLITSKYIYNILWLVCPYTFSIQSLAEICAMSKSIIIPGWTTQAALCSKSCEAQPEHGEHQLTHHAALARFRAGNGSWVRWIPCLGLGPRIFHSRGCGFFI